MLDTLSRWKRKATSLPPFSNSHSITDDAETDTNPSSITHRRTDVAQLTISQPIPRSSPSPRAGFDISSGSHNTSASTHSGLGTGVSNNANVGAGIGTGLGMSVSVGSSLLANDHLTPSFGQGTLTPQAAHWQNTILYSSSGGRSHSNSGSPASIGGSVGGERPFNMSWSSEAEDNRFMGSFGRRRLGSGTSSTATLQPQDAQMQVQDPYDQQGILPPAVVRLDSNSSQHGDEAHRSPSHSHSPHLGGGQKGSLRLQTNVTPTPGASQAGGAIPYANSAMNHSAHSLRLPTNSDIVPPVASTEARIPTYSTDVYANAYAYTMAKQLSPIAEQDYLSPSDSHKKARSIIGSINRGGSPNSGKSGSGAGSTTGNVGTIFGSSPGTGTGTGAGTNEGEGESAAGRKSWVSAPEDLPGPATPAGGMSHHTDASLGSVSAGTPQSPHGNPSTVGSASNASEIIRPSPTYGSPFITRQLNRTISQTSSRSHTTNSTSIVASSHGIGAPGSTGRQSAAKPAIPPPALTTAPEPPTIPPLDLLPHFPGPHPSHIGPGPPLRPKKSKTTQAPAVMPKIPGSHEGYYDEAESEDRGGLIMDEEAMMYESGMSEDQVSLHAESYVTASDKGEMGGRETVRYVDEVKGKYTRDHESGNAAAGSSNGNHGGIGVVIDVEKYVDGEIVDIEAGRDISGNTGRSGLPSASESFITRRWDRVGKSGLPTDGRMRRSITIFRAKKRQLFMRFTPAFWAFWLGFFCPVLWLVGGWHFTNFGEQPPKMSIWEFYFSVGFWKEMCCCLARRKKEVQRKGKEKEMEVKGGEVENEKENTSLYPPLPRWVAEKQSSDDGRARLNDLKRSLKGISFGYPFVVRPSMIPTRRSAFGRLLQRMMSLVGKPNRLLDHLYGVKLKEVRGRPESGRRMFDPWIQRCRYACCYALLLVAVALCTASTYLIVFNTRQLR